MEIISEKKCEVCGKVSDKCCSLCRKVNYCSIEHQKQDWKAHKKACRASLHNYKICQNSQLGRHFIAQQDIPAGCLILKEYPALVSFSESTPEDMMEGKSDHINCFACGKKIQDFFVQKSFCPKCRLPICSAKCCLAKQHSEYECRYFVEKEHIFPPIASDYDFRLLMGMLGCIRAIGIKKYNPGLWTEISNLQADFSDLNTMSFYPEMAQDIFEIYQCLDLENDRFEELYDPDVVTKISGIILINSFNTSYPEDSGKYHSTVKRLYAKISLMSHSCFPNAIRRVGPGPDFELKIYASRDISEGEIIASSYPENFEMTFKGAFQRQLNSLKDRREFFCLCTRCLDPTEKQTFLSALKCPLNMELSNGRNKCPEGFMLIENPLNLNSHWNCNKCGFKWKTKIIRHMLEGLEKIYKNLNFENLASVQGFLDQLRRKCHPNFWLILKCEEKCVDTFVRSDKIENMDLEGVIFLSKIINHILKVFELSVGGIFLNRVQYMVELLVVLKIKHRLRRTDWEATHLDKSKDLDDILNIMRKIEDTREKFLAVYQNQEGSVFVNLYEYLQNEFPKDKFYKELK